MRLSRLLSLIILIFTHFSCNQSNSNPGAPVSVDTSEEALRILRKTLRDTLRWEKVHAAEALIQLNYYDEIEAVFLAEEKFRGEEAPYRIGIWRVLAQLPANAKEANPWIRKIVEVYQNPDAPDRVHASESLAKLRYPVDTVPDNLAPILKLFSQWSNAYKSSESFQSAKSFLSEKIGSASASPREKRLAAYALRHLGQLNGDELQMLSKAALDEPDSSSSKVFLLSAALVNVPVDSTKLENALRSELLQEQLYTNKSDLFEFTQALAIKGKSEDVPLLTELLQGEIPFELSENDKNDIQVGAAYALSRIDRRNEPSLVLADWIVIVMYGALMLGIGWYYSRKNKSREDYLLGGRKMNPIAVGISLFATLLSTLSYLSYPGEMIKNGPVIFAGLLALPLVYYVAGWWLVPRIMKLQVTSAYELLEKRFGLSVRMLATFMFLFLRFLWMATIIYVTIEIALFSVIPFDRSLALPIGIVLMIVTIIYTAMGGLKAVVVTDVLQSIIFLGGAFLSIIVVCIHFNSLTSWIPTEWPVTWDPPRLGFDPKERTTVANAIMMIFLWYICTSGSDQMAIQRYLSTKDVKAARKTLGVSLYTNVLAKVLLGLVGLAVFAYFNQNPHLLADGQTLREQADTLFPRFILVGLPAGISGLVIAGLLAAAMSSISSGVNSVSSVISEDLIQRFRRSSADQEGLLRQVQFLSYFIGAVVMLLSIYIGNVEGNLLDVVNKVVNLLVAPLFVLFFLALFVPFASTSGALAGGILSTLAACAISFYNVFGITVLWIIPISLLVGILNGCAVSLFDKMINRSQPYAQK